MKKSGFTLLEIIIAVFVLTVAIVGSFALIQKSIVSASQAQFRLTAAYLAQEGMEIVRNIRDTNWLEGENWDAGIAITSDYRLDYQSSEFPDTTCNLGSGNYLKYDGNFYTCSSGIDTKFKRTISISSEELNKMKVSVKVEWEERGRTDSIEALEYLYNWH